MPVIIDFYRASQAIIEQQLIFEHPHPELPYKGLGPVRVTEQGNGRWQHTSSYYYNCGANVASNTPPAGNQTVALDQGDRYALEAWFMHTYPNKQPKVLQDGTKWNFTLVHNNVAFNFHVLVSG